MHIHQGLINYEVPEVVERWFREMATGRQPITVPASVSNHVPALELSFPFDWSRGLQQLSGSLSFCCCYVTRIDSCFVQRPSHHLQGSPSRPRQAAFSFAFHTQLYPRIRLDSHERVRLCPQVRALHWDGKSRGSLARLVSLGADSFLHRAVSRPRWSSDVRPPSS